MKKTAQKILILSGLSFFIPLFMKAQEATTTFDQMNGYSLYNQYIMIFIGLLVGFIYILIMRIRGL